jgi:hypothetical protein
MAKRSRSTFQKHSKEHARQQKQQAKAARRLEAKQRRATAESGRGDTTPDLAGLCPGPQPLPTAGDGVSGHAYPLSPCGRGDPPAGPTPPAHTPPAVGDDEAQDRPAGLRSKAAACQPVTTEGDRMLSMVRAA